MRVEDTTGEGLARPPRPQLRILPIFKVGKLVSPPWISRKPLLWSFTRLISLPHGPIPWVVLPAVPNASRSSLRVHYNLPLSSPLGSTGYFPPRCHKTVAQLHLLSSPLTTTPRQLPCRQLMTTHLLIWGLAFCQAGNSEPNPPTQAQVQHRTPSTRCLPGRRARPLTTQMM